MRKILGTFKVVSGKMRVSDPCYEKSLKDAGSVFDVINGKWRAHINVNREGYVTSLVAVLPDAKVPEGAYWHRCASLGVDSGQMSIFDNKFYQRNSEGKGLPKADFITKKDYKKMYSFYAAVCEMTCSDGGRAGILPHGAVSRTAYGDGEYPCEVLESARGKVIGIRIHFGD